MLTSFDQVRDWIIDNGFKRWILYRDASRTEMIVDSAGFPATDMNARLATTEKYLRYAGGHAYAQGGANATKTEMNVCAEIRLDDMNQTQQNTAGVAGYPSIGELTETITKQVRAEIEAERYRKEREDFEKEKKEFEEEKKSAVGAVIHYFAPIGKMLMENKIMRNVAGVDAEEPVVAQPIQPITTQEAETEPEPEQQPESPFTPEQEQEIYELMVRFAAVEPDYLPLLRSVVEMAESGDSTYKMAKGFLVK